MYKFRLISFPIFLYIVIISCSEAIEERSGYIEGAESARIYYEISGTSPDTLVIIHGGPGAGISSIRPSTEPLNDYFTLIYFDQRGGGRSTLPENTELLRPEYFTADLDSVRSHFGLNKMNVFAHSFGALIIAGYMQEHPDRIEKLVLHAATGPVRSMAGEYYRQLAARSTQSPDTILSNRSSELFQNLLAGNSEDPVSDCLEYELIVKKIAALKGEESSYAGTTCDASAEAVRYYYSKTAQIAPSFYGNWDYSGSFHSLNTEILVVYGEQDTLALPQQQLWADSFQDGKLFLVPDTDKAALSGNPEVLIPVLVDFLNR